MSPSPNKEPTPSDTDCAPPAITYHLPEEHFQDVGESSVKCTKCNTVTNHEWVKITPFAAIVSEPNDFDSLEFMKLPKRLSICTKCGTLRLTN